MKSYLNSQLENDQIEPVAGTSASAASQSTQPAASDTNEQPPLRSVHTSNFSAILQELGAFVLVTTYQAGKLVMLRPDGDRLNTHFRGFSKPMGLAVDGDRLAIGTSVEIWEYHNAPAVARRLVRKEEGGRRQEEQKPAASADSFLIPHSSSLPVHDACFLPRSSVCTGDIQIHEMAFGKSQGNEDRAPRSAAIMHACARSSAASEAAFRCVLIESGRPFRRLRVAR